MLDQNTDRMWFVIGAVIVGAAIIFIANGTLPSIFASVGASLDGMSGDALGVISEMDVYVDDNLLTISDIDVLHADSNLGSGGTLKRSRITKRSNSTVSGYRVLHSDFGFKPDTEYVFSYEYQKVDGSLLGFGGHLGGTSPSHMSADVYVDGVLNGTDYGENTSAYIEDSTDRYSVAVYFKTPSVIPDTFRIEIQPNRLLTSPVVTVDIFDIALREVGD